MPEALHIEKLNHVARPTKRLEESCRFYVDVMGFREISRPAFAFRGAWLYRVDMQIHLIEDTNAPDPPPEINTRERHMAFAVDDLDAMEVLLKAHGVAYRRNLIPDRGIHQIFFRDPDGHLIEIGMYGILDQ